MPFVKAKEINLTDKAKEILDEIIRKKSSSQAQVMRAEIILEASKNNDNFIDIINGTGHSTAEMVKYYDSRDKLKYNSVNKIGAML